VYGGPIGKGVVDAALVPVAWPGLAVIGEPEATSIVEHKVVRAPQPMAVALGVEHRRLPRGQVDALDAPAAVVGRLVARDVEP